MQHQSIRYSSLRAVLLKRDGFLSQSNTKRTASILDDEVDIVKWFLIAMDIECLEESFTEYNDSQLLQDLKKEDLVDLSNTDKM